MKKRQPKRAPEASGGSQKRSITLYAADLQKIDEIKAFMAQHGCRNMGDSVALRLACRALDLTDLSTQAQMFDSYIDMWGEDKRRPEQAGA